MMGRALSIAVLGFVSFLAGCPKNDPFVPKPPTLSDVSPASFAAGDTITLTGVDFSTTLLNNSVFVGGVQARVLSGTTTTLVVLVPPCVTSGDVQVKVQVGRAVSKPLTRVYTSTSPVLSLNELEGITLSGANQAGCLRLPGGGARYLVVPQFAGDSTQLPTKFAYSLRASGAAAIAGPAVAELQLARTSRNTVQRRFDMMLRMQERQLAPRMSLMASEPQRRAAELKAFTLGSTRTFRVLGDLNATSFKTATAQLKYIGNHVLLYFDNETPSGGFSDAEILAFGELFDKTLYELAVATFGSPSDIDANQHIAVLFSPYINALTPSAQCSTSGFVTGYFFGYDLDSQSSNSNKGEVFYALTPDPAGVRSCVHTVAQVKQLVPATFIHELQHMISFNQHVLLRGGSDEEVWLNEGLSHIAEEVASLYYENKCAGITTPPCRSNAASPFPDSALKFISGNLLDAYDYLRKPDTVSITTFKDFGELEERGAAWFFLRWLGDQKGDAIYSQLVQTNLTGIRNIENRSGESIASLLGDLGIAAYTDSLPGVARTSVPQRYRFSSRNFRKIYSDFYTFYPGTLPAPFPIVPKALGVDVNSSGSMVQGTMSHYILDTPSASTSVSLQFSKPDLKAFPGTLGAQLGVFRLPPTP